MLLLISFQADQDSVADALLWLLIAPTRTPLTDLSARWLIDYLSDIAKRQVWADGHSDRRFHPWNLTTNDLPLSHKNQ